jgi:histidinol-phosphate/aromatic aminotransferase/cobyric acid decarboxylase-like protein
MEKAHTLQLAISMASISDHQAIYRLRHDVYATELDQYKSQEDGILRDANNIRSDYIIATVNNELAGFVGITPPSSPRFSIDKYLSRTEIPIKFDDNIYEIRALTVKQSLRGWHISLCLMYAAFRWIEAHGGKQILSIGRHEILNMYLRLGLEKQGLSFTSGAVTYHLIGAPLSDIVNRTKKFKSYLKRIKKQIDWKLGITFESPSDCYHGGAFFEAIGDQFDDLDRIKNVISADVLDAWFPPAPAAQQLLIQYLPWMMRTSPPTRAEGLSKIIANIRGVTSDCILPGGGSSALIFLALRHWLNSDSRVLILDPTYGEYLHVLEKVIQCKVERFLLERSNGYRLDLQLIQKKLTEGFDLFIWVNPNSPTGIHVKKEDVISVLKQAHSCKRVWIDETYVEYAGANQSLESFSAQSRNVIVCKSLSKVYALSGVRAAYLCASPHQLESLQTLTPPWSVSLPAQIAATYALQSQNYYSKRYEETHILRTELVNGLRKLGIKEIIPGIANFVMFHLPMGSKDVASIIMKCREYGLYLRDLSGMSTDIGNTAMRIAVKDAETNKRMLLILKKALY